MKRFLFILGLVTMVASIGQAVDRSRNMSVSPFTGDNISYAKVAVSSTTAATLAAYSSSRGALTCINSDSSNAVYLGSSTSVTAGGAASFPLFSRQSVQILNNGQVYAIADTGIANVNVYCITEY